MLHLMHAGYVLYRARGVCRICRGGVSTLARKIFDTTPTFITTPTDHQCKLLTTRDESPGHDSISQSKAVPEHKERKAKLLELPVVLFHQCMISWIIHCDKHEF